MFVPVNSTHIVLPLFTTLEQADHLSTSKINFYRYCACMIYDNENAIGFTLPKCILNFSCQFTCQFISVLNTRSKNKYRGRRKIIPARSKINDSCEIMARDKLNITLAYIAIDYGKNQITTDPEIVNHECYIHGTLQMPLWHTANCMQQGDKWVPPIHSQSHYKCLKQVVTLEVKRDFDRCRRPFQLCQPIKHTRNVSMISTTPVDGLAA